MITLRQIKAARALLEWPQTTLAKKAGVSLRALTNIESGKTVPRSDTQICLQQALEKGGVEFTSAEGVRLRGEVLEIYKYEGKEALRMVFTDIFTVLHEGGEVVGLSLDERHFYQKGKSLLDGFYKEMEKRKITERLLIRKGDTFLISKKESYRWIRSELFTEVPFLVYGNTVLQILWKPSMKVIVIRNEALANAYRKQFDLYWLQESEPLP